PQLSSRGDLVILSWLEVSGERATLKFAERTPSGWSNAQTVASGTHFFINSFDVPSVRALADATLVAHWEERLGADEDSDASKVMLSWSKDQGRTWSRPVTPHHDGTNTEHGFASLFQAPGAGLGLVWIDGRATNPETESGDMRLRAAVSHDAGRTFGVPVRVDDAGSLGRLGVQLLDDGSAAVIWIERANQRSQLRVRVITPAGMRSAPVTIADTEGSRYPRIIRDRGELLFSWTDTDKGPSQVRTARASMAQQAAASPR